MDSKSQCSYITVTVHTRGRNRNTKYDLSLVKMAPGCLPACRHSLFLPVLVFCFLVCFITRSVCSPLVYDRVTLLNIRSAVSDCLFCDTREDWHLYVDVPVALRKVCYLPGCLCLWRKRRRKRGKRAGGLVRSKKIGRFPFIGPPSFVAEVEEVNLRCSYLVPVFPSPASMSRSSRMVRVRRRSAARGVNHLILRSLRDGNSVNFFNQSSLSSSDTIPVTMALINARSLANKTFILNDLFASNELDFLFVTETWLKGGDMSPLSELSSAGCSFFSTPRSIGRGGGLAVVFKEKFKCRLLPSDSFCSFESQLITLNSFKSVLCVLIYRPPNSHGDFIQEFS